MTSHVISVTVATILSKIKILSTFSSTSFRVSEWKCINRGKNADEKGQRRTVLEIFYTLQMVCET